MRQQGNTEGTKVGPEKEVEGVQCVCTTTGMFYVVLTSIFTIRGEFNSTVVEKTFWIDLSIILMKTCK